MWKELRLQRAFWIAMLVLTVLLQWVVVGMTPAGPPRTNWLFEVAMVLAALYAVGCGATLFATEHETGTYDFQR
ncbi:MAG: hypothetical protein GTO31_13900, partial [Xanthomonadales bacterium]|nr:hypothetical protein [Xanthomonadales bacterium]